MRCVVSNIFSLFLKRAIAKKPTPPRRIYSSLSLPLLTTTHLRLACVVSSAQGAALPYLGVAAAEGATGSGAGAAAGAAGGAATGGVSVSFFTRCFDGKKK